MKFQTSLILLGGVALSALALSLPVTALAEEFIEEVAVTATRYEKNLSDIGSSITVLTQEDMQQSQSIFVQDIISSIPGLTLNQNGTFGGLASVRIRGAKSDQTLVLIDGVQTNDVSQPGGGYNFANLDPNGIKRIEVLRGPQSILYGSDAIGGVINIITISGTEGLEGSLYGEAGSFNTFRAGGNIAGGTEKLTFSLSGNAITTQGISKKEEHDGNTERDGYRNVTLHGKVTARLSEDSRLQLISRYTDSRNEYDGFSGDADRVGFTKEVLLAGRGYFNFLDGRFQNTLSVEYSSTKRRRETGGVLAYKGKSEGERFNLDYFGHYEMSDTFGLSFGLQHEETKSATTSARKFNIDSVFSEVSWQGVPGLTVTAGLRYDDHNQYGGTTTPRLTAAYFIEESQTKFFANWGEGFKAPTVFQLTYICSFCGLTSPNGDLLPEESSGWEVGVEQSLLEEKITLGATYFDQTIKNMIDFSFVVGYGNIAAVRSKGIELHFEAEVTKRIFLSGNYTFTNARDSNTGEELIRVPRNVANAQIRWNAFDPFNIALNMTYNDRETDKYSPGTESWTRFDLKLSYDITDDVELYGRIDNLFNREYQQINSYGTPDRSYFAGVRGKF